MKTSCRTRQRGLLTWVWPRWIPLDGSARAFERFEWLERNCRSRSFPTQIIWGREDEVFDAATFSSRFKQMMPHAEGPHMVTGRHFLQEDSGAEIAGLIRAFLDRLDAQEPTAMTSVSVIEKQDLAGKRFEFGLGRGPPWPLPGIPRVLRPDI